jgi:hypothetical protein
VAEQKEPGSAVMLETMRILKTLNLRLDRSGLKACTLLLTIQIFARRDDFGQKSGRG